MQTGTPSPPSGAMPRSHSRPERRRCRGWLAPAGSAPCHPASTGKAFATGRTGCRQGSRYCVLHKHSIREPCKCRCGDSARAGAGYLACMHLCLPSHVPGAKPLLQLRVCVGEPDRVLPRAPRAVSRHACTVSSWSVRANRWDTGVQKLPCHSVLGAGTCQGTEGV